MNKKGKISSRQVEWSKMLGYSGNRSQSALEPAQALSTTSVSSCLWGCENVRPWSVLTVRHEFVPKPHLFSFPQPLVMIDYLSRRLGTKAAKFGRWSAQDGCFVLVEPYRIRLEIDYVFCFTLLEYFISMRNTVRPESGTNRMIFGLRIPVRRLKLRSYNSESASNRKILLLPTCPVLELTPVETFLYLGSE